MIALASAVAASAAKAGSIAMRMGWIVAAVVAAIVLYAIVVFNRLIRQRNVVREGWSGIDVQLRRRTDLIPNLMEAVKGYAAHERGLFEELTRHRAGSIAAGDVGSQAAAEQALSGSLHKLIAVAEAYPELKANQNFLDLQRQLAEIEDQIQMARRYYNGAVRNFNIGIQSFPDVILARLAGFTEATFFELDDRAQAAAPQVTFAGKNP
jgi:LemA protein